MADLFCTHCSPGDVVCNKLFCAPERLIVEVTMAMLTSFCTSIESSFPSCHSEFCSSSVGKRGIRRDSQTNPQAHKLGHGGGCYAAPDWSAVPGMDQWCQANCPTGYYDNSTCLTAYCTCPDQTTVMTTAAAPDSLGNCRFWEASAIYSGVGGMDEWCQSVCSLGGDCPASHCQCKPETTTAASTTTTTKTTQSSTAPSTTQSTTTPTPTTQSTTTPTSTTQSTTTPTSTTQSTTTPTSTTQSTTTPTSTTQSTTTPTSTTQSTTTPTSTTQSTTTPTSTTQSTTTPTSTTQSTTTPTSTTQSTTTPTSTTQSTTTPTSTTQSTTTPTSTTQSTTTPTSTTQSTTTPTSTTQSTTTPTSTTQSTTTPTSTTQSTTTPISTTQSTTTPTSTTQSTTTPTSTTQSTTTPTSTTQSTTTPTSTTQSTTTPTSTTQSTTTPTSTTQSSTTPTSTTQSSSSVQSSTTTATTTVATQIPLTNLTDEDSQGVLSRVICDQATVQGHNTMTTRYCPGQDAASETGYNQNIIDQVLMFTPKILCALTNTAGRSTTCPNMFCGESPISQQMVRSSMCSVCQTFTDTLAMGCSLAYCQ